MTALPTTDPRGTQSGRHSANGSTNESCFQVFEKHLIEPWPFKISIRPKTA
jgi:hypothetical protein